MAALSSEQGAESSAEDRRVLLLAYHFPPDASSTGRLRTLGFAQHLPVSGWTPTVLTASKHAYERVDARGLADIPDALPVYRAFALDTRRHMGWRGKYVSWLAVPDRWIWWFPAAFVRGLKLIRKRRIDVIWSTYPIATTHLIALALARATGLPWVADFRDPVVTDGSRLKRRIASWIECKTLAGADRVVFTTPGARRLYAERFPDAADRFTVIPNGYEEAIMSAVSPADTEGRARVQLVHGGVLYPQGRNPQAFFAALSQLKAAGRIDSNNFNVILRASGHDSEYQQVLRELDIADLVDLAPPIAYRDALQEQADADGLLLFQGPEFNSQIPAKVYEYLRIGKPIIALTDPLGDTAELLQSIDGAAVMAPMEDSDAIASGLDSFLSRREAGTLAMPDARVVEGYSRVAGAGQLAHLLSAVTR